MPEAFAVETVPLVAGEDGVIRVESTRVPLGTVVGAFLDGSSAEEISEQYPSVSLGVAYQVIGYYLLHRAELDSYLRGREAAREQTQRANESRWPADGLRARLLSRRK